MITPMMIYGFCFGMWCMLCWELGRYDHTTGRELLKKGFWLGVVLALSGWMLGVVAQKHIEFTKYAAWCESDPAFKAFTMNGKNVCGRVKTREEMEATKEQTQ